MIDKGTVVAFERRLQFNMYNKPCHYVINLF